MRSCTGIRTSVRSSPPRALYFCILPCGASLTGLCAVRAYKDFMLRCTVRAPRAFCAVRAYKSFIQRAPGLVLLCTVRALARCEPTKALRFCVPYERQELCAVRASKGFVPLCTVRAPRALRGASLQRLCASVCCKSFTSFVRCEPTKAFYRVRAPRALRCEPPKVFYRVRAPRALRGVSLQRLSTVYERQELCAVRASKGFVPLCAVRASRALCDASLQRLSTVCWCSPLKICNVLVYENLYICTVCTSSHDICCSVREPVCLYVAERSIHVV